jgi:hypothetical protein
MLIVFLAALVVVWLTVLEVACAAWFHFAK